MISSILLPMHTHKVVSKFVDRLLLAQEDSDLLLAQEKVAIVTRQLAWLKRSSSGGAEGRTWRPRRLHRVASRRWFMLLDNGVDLHCSFKTTIGQYVIIIVFSVLRHVFHFHNKQTFNHAVFGSPTCAHPGQDCPSSSVTRPSLLGAKMGGKFLPPVLTGLLQPFGPHLDHPDSHNLLNI